MKPQIVSMLGISLRGMLMGIADLIPGVSGGTMALITGIYPRLVDAIAAFGPETLMLFLRGRITEFWRRVDGGFLLSLMMGIGFSVLVFARLLAYLLSTVPHLVWALFLGLIIASVLHLFREIRHWRPQVVVAIVAGAAIAWWLTHLPAFGLSPTPLVIAVCGMIAICAWILPGISGSFILLVLGMYEYVIGSIKAFDVEVLLSFMVGAAGGLLLFTRVLKWALSNFYSTIMGVLTGFLIGSLHLLWPWQLSLPGSTKAGGVPVMPADWTAQTGMEADIAVCIALTIVGLVGVLALEFAGRQGQGEPNG